MERAITLKRHSISFLHLNGTIECWNVGNKIIFHSLVLFSLLHSRFYVFNAANLLPSKKNSAASALWRQDNVPEIKQKTVREKLLLNGVITERSLYSFTEINFYPLAHLLMQSSCSSSSAWRIKERVHLSVAHVYTSAAMIRIKGSPVLKGCDAREKTICIAPPESRALNLIICTEHKFLNVCITIVWWPLRSRTRALWHGVKQTLLRAIKF